MNVLLIPLSLWYIKLAPLLDHFLFYPILGYFQHSKPTHFPAWASDTPNQTVCCMNALLILFELYDSLWSNSTQVRQKGCGHLFYLTWVLTPYSGPPQLSDALSVSSKSSQLPSHETLPFTQVSANTLLWYNLLYCNSHYSYLTPKPESVTPPTQLWTIFWSH